MVDLSVNKLGLAVFIWEVSSLLVDEAVVVMSVGVFNRLGVSVVLGGEHFSRRFPILSFVSRFLFFPETGVRMIGLAVLLRCPMVT